MMDADAGAGEIEPTSGRGAQIATAICALLLAAAGVLVAPEAWTDGPATLEIRYRGLPAVSVPLTIGTGERFSFDRADPRDRDRRVMVEIPAGVSSSGPTWAWIQVKEQGEFLRAALDDIDLTLVLSDGRRELIPVMKWDAERGALMATRRPPVKTGVVLGLLGFVLVLWVTGAVPLFVTSLMVPVVLVVTNVGTAQAALAPFFHPVIALFFGGFLMAEAMRRVRLDHRIAVLIVAHAGRRPAMLFATLIGAAAFLSMWMSNTAATAVLIPIALAVTRPLESAGYRKACILGIAFAATAGGVGSAIGTPANPLAVEFLDTFADRQLSFVDWFAYGLPFVVLFLPLLGVYLWKRSKATVDPELFEQAHVRAVEERKAIGRMTGDQLIVLAVFVLVMGLWLTQTWHHINTGIIAVGGAVLLALLGKLQGDDLQRISWSALLTFGGGLALGIFLGESGASDWLATRLTGLSVLPSWIGVAVVGAVALGLTAVASNTASAAMLIPLAIPLAGVLGVDPVQLVLVVAIASSIDFALVIGTPPTMIAYSTGLFTTREIFRTGIVLDLMGIVLLVTGVAWLWSVLGLV